ncbi:hypothetical protein [Aquimarina spongiae]|uniref:Uncharacterized protein n=1 Tax=Aquimarina spongiae TaxID=570521 RepID=A0A1M6JF72_9FLAO|nr:hypothetical protein [Aquimarina spongiae]SHJ45330.1 hypothetical protein SAMN04488508_10936 [Aquimarina spongiae]
MNADFDNIITKLKTNDNLIIEVKDVNTGTEIVKVKDRLGYQQIIDKNQSVGGLLEQIKKDGFSKIQIQLFERRGNANVRKGVAKNFQLTEKEETQEEAPTHNPSVQQPTMSFPNYGLNGPGGLSGQELINLNVDRHMLGYTKQDLEVEKTERKRLEKENEDLKEKLRTAERQNDNKEFWGGLIKQVAPALTGLATAMKPGLNGPQVVPEYEGMKGNLIKVIQEAPSISDDQGMAAYNVLNAYALENKDLIEELNELFTKHGINNGNNNG